MVSKWHPSLKYLEFDRSKYRHVIPVLSDKLYELILKIVPYNIIKYIFGYTSIDRIVYYRGINTLLKNIKPDIIISHVHFHLFKSIKKAIPNAKHIFYFHSSNLGDWPISQIKFLYKNADGIISICNYAFLDVMQKHALTHMNSKVIYNGIDTNMFSVQKRLSNRKKDRSEYGISKNDIVILYAGRIHESKGVDFIIESFLECYENCSDLRLVIVGGGYSKYDNKRVIEKTKIHIGKFAVIR